MFNVDNKVTRLGPCSHLTIKWSCRVFWSNIDNLKFKWECTRDALRKQWDLIAQSAFRGGLAAYGQVLLAVWWRWVLLLLPAVVVQSIKTQEADQPMNERESLSRTRMSMSDLSRDSLAATLSDLWTRSNKPFCWTGSCEWMRSNWIWLETTE